VLSAGVSAAAQRVFSLVQNISTIADTVESNKKQSESLARYVLLLNLPLQRRASSSPEACQLVIYELNKIAEFLKQFEPTQSRIKKLLLWKNSTAHQSSLS
jgi:CII-binding regulator of phage lambda lysogenization HflD